VLPLVVLLSAQWEHFFIGLICGVAVVFSIEFIEIKIDDPVGAISVHGVCGALGTFISRCFAIDGGFYGGGFEKLGVQVEYFQLRHGQWALLYSFSS
jgi:Amt family ammonium transporter